MLVAAMLLAAAPADPKTFELQGHLQPPGRAAVSLYGATSPFSSSTLADHRGRFLFRRLLPGPYTVAVFLPGRGEGRRTIEVGPGSAGARGKVTIHIDLSDSRLVSDQVLRRRNLVSARELAIPEQAHREYANAQKKLSRRDTAGAIAHLEQAVRLAPQFAVAWNNLGTIAYQSRNFRQAETHFRQSLEQDPEAFEPLVNLGGVLLTLEQMDEALQYNQYAVLVRPQDALANSQLGMNYFYLADLDRALKHLTTARSLDPAHFSHPQLLIAEIHLRRNNPAAAAAELEDFLRRHPDWPQAAQMRENIAKLRRE